MSRIDVVVPCYNYERFLTACVRSVLAQSVNDLRVLIIDDASSDGSLSIARMLERSDRRVSVIAHARNHGHIPTFNEGIDWARGDYFLLLSADDLVVPGAFDRAIRVMDSDPEIVMTYGDYAVWHDQKQPPTLETPGSFTWRYDDLAEQMCALATNFVQTPTAIVRTSVQKAIGGYRPHLYHAGDLEMWLRFAAAGRVGRINAVQGIYRKHATSMSNHFWQNLLLEYEQRKLAFDAYFDAQRNSAPLAARRRQTYRVLAGKAFESGVGHIRRGRVRGGLELMRWAMSVDQRLRYLPPLWRIVKPPGQDGRRWAADALRAGARRLTGRGATEIARGQTQG